MKIFSALYDRTFGYSRAVAAIIAGLILVAWPETIKNIIIYVLGGLIIATGIFSLVSNRSAKQDNEDRQNRSLLSVNGIVNITFGLILILFPSFFTGIIMFLFGAVLLLFGIGSLISFFSAKKAVNASWGFAIVPALITGCGIAMFFFPNSSGNALFVIFGIALLVYGLSELIETRVVNTQLQKITKNNIEDVPYQEL